MNRNFLHDTNITPKPQKSKSQFFSKQRMAVLALLAVFSFSTFSSTMVMADSFDTKINQLRAQNQQKQNKQSVLNKKALTFQEKINGLRSQIRILQKQIAKDQAKSRALKTRIAAAEKEMAKHKELLGKNIRKMYTEGDMTTLEMLASSKDLGEYVDREQYRNSLNSEIKESLDVIDSLKRELTTKRDLLAKTISDSKKRQKSLNSQRREVARLLAMNTAQRRKLESQIAGNNQKISRLRAEQAAANASLFGGGLRNIPDSSGYPWANYNPFPNEVADPWGMYLRQCVSYTAWKVWKSGRHMPFWGGRGNANKWDDNARAAGIPVNHSPRRGAVGISNSGYYGHAVYVEHVYGDGRILISQYNAGWDGRYSEAVVHKSKFVYIHF